MTRYAHIIYERNSKWYYSLSTRGTLFERSPFDTKAEADRAVVRYINEESNEDIHNRGSKKPQDS
jgi:hypothetical protein